MFQVEPNLWLQWFSSPRLTALMQGISLLGYDWVYIAAVIVLGFGCRLRPMIGVMIALLFTATVTYTVKDSLQLPRPVQVDSRVLDKGRPNQRWQVERGGASSPLGLPTPEAIAAQRAALHPDYGFISGHVSAATSFCLALLLFFRIRRPAAIVLCVAWPLLMVLSRMYLGRHFLADALGGLAAGAMCSLIVLGLLRRARSSRYALGATTMALVVCSLVWPWMGSAEVGKLAGALIVWALLERHGWLLEGGLPWARIGRVIVAVLLYGAVRAGLQKLDATFDLAGYPLAPFLMSCGGVVCLFYGGAKICEFFGLYQKPTAVMD